MQGKRILMLVGEYSEEYEIFVFEQGMQAVGHQVDIVCPDTEKGYKLRSSVHDFGPLGKLDGEGCEVLTGDGPGVSGFRFVPSGLLPSRIVLGFGHEENMSGVNLVLVLELGEMIVVVRRDVLCGHQLCGGDLGLDQGPHEIRLVNRRQELRVGDSGLLHYLSVC